MTIEATIRTMAQGLNRGGKIRLHCPFCHATHENSFDLIRRYERPHILSFRCYRGSCGKTGIVIDREGVNLIMQPDVETEHHRVGKALTEHDEIPNHFAEYIAEKYHLSLSTLRQQGCRYDSTYETLCMPWLDHHQVSRGWVEKRFDENAPKSHHDLCRVYDDSRLGFTAIPKSYDYVGTNVLCVLVEDMLSAYKVTQEGAGRSVGVAMLGSGISNKDAMLLGTIFAQVMVHTDKDIWPKESMRISNKLKPYTQVCATIHPDGDLKDLPRAVVSEHILRLEGCF